MVWKTPMKSRKRTNVGRNRWYVHWTEYSQIYSVVGLFNSIPVAWYISRRNVQTGWNNTVHVWTLHTVMFSLVCAQNEGDFVCPTHGTAVPCVHWIKTTWKRGWHAVSFGRRRGNDGPMQACATEYGSNHKQNRKSVWVCWMHGWVCSDQYHDIWEVIDSL